MRDRRTKDDTGESNVSKLIIQGAGPLKGRVRVSGAKNSVLPIIAASLLADGRSVIEEVPYLNDVKIMCELVDSLGASTEFSEDRTRLEISSRSLLNTTAPYELVNRCGRLFL